MPRLVALRRLDLDHVGAVIGQHLRAERPRQHARQVDDTKAAGSGAPRERSEAGMAAAISRGSAAPRSPRAQHRQLVVLVARLLLDLDQVTAVLDVLARHLALDEQDVARRIVAADLAGGVAQEAVVAHPVGEMMRQPRAALGAVVVGAGRADFAANSSSQCTRSGQSGMPKRFSMPRPGWASISFQASLLARM